MNAVLVINKGVGPTSFDVIRELKKIYPGEKIGHAGSLDPFATGVLVILFGKATKLSGALLNADKSYRALLELGKTTDSLDLTGQITEEKPVPALSEEGCKEVLKSFEGEWNQTPPMYSAKKIQGVRLYTLARKSIEVPREKVPVQIFALELLKLETPHLEFAVHCSKGTYVRALAAEIGERLGTCAYLKTLQRLSCGEFHLGESVTIEDLKERPQLITEVGYGNYVRLLSREGFGRPNPVQEEDSRALPNRNLDAKRPPLRRFEEGEKAPNFEGALSNH